MNVRRVADNLKRPYYVVGLNEVIPAAEAKPGSIIQVEDGQKYPYEVWLSKNDLRRRRGEPVPKYRWRPSVTGNTLPVTGA